MKKLIILVLLFLSPIIAQTGKSVLSTAQINMIKGFISDSLLTRDQQIDSIFSLLGEAGISDVDNISIILTSSDPPKLQINVTWLDGRVDSLITTRIGQYTLDDLEDVLATTPDDNSILIYRQNTGFWETTPYVTGGSVSNADSLGGQPASAYVRKSDSTIIFATPSQLNSGLALKLNYDFSGYSEGVITNTDLLIYQDVNSGTPRRITFSNFRSGLNIPDTTSLSNRINLKLNATDTLSLSNRINLKLNATDTTSLSNRINLKLNATDTLSLSNRINTKLTATDTLSLSNRINLKLNITDTTAFRTFSDLKYLLSSALNTYWDSVAVKDYLAEILQGDSIIGGKATLDSLILAFWNDELGGGGGISQDSLNTKLYSSFNTEYPQVTTPSVDNYIPVLTGIGNHYAALDDLPISSAVQTALNELEVGGVADIEYIRARLQLDTVATLTAFTPVTDATVSTLYTSDIIGVNSDNPNYSVIKTWTDIGEYRVRYNLRDTPTWSDWQSTAGYYRMVDSAQVRHTSSSENETETEQTFYAGNDSEIFSVTTAAEALPDAPTGFEAEGGTSDTEIPMTWTDAVGDIDSVRIYEGSTNDTTAMTWIASVVQGAETYTRTGRTAETTYWYAVKSYDGTNESYFSNTDSATTASGGGTYNTDSLLYQFVYTDLTNGSISSWTDRVQSLAIGTLDTTQRPIKNDDALWLNPSGSPYNDRLFNSIFENIDTLYGSFTMEGVIFLTDTTDWQNIFMYGRGSGMSMHTRGNRFCFGVYDAGNTTAYGKDMFSTPFLNTWAYVVGSYNASTNTINFYLNGVSQANASGYLAESGEYIYVGEVTNGAKNVGVKYYAIRRGVAWTQQQAEDALNSTFIQGLMP